MWVPCGAEGVRGSRTGLPIFAPLGPLRPAHRKPLWWLGARLGVFQVFQEPQKVSSVALLLLSTGYASISHSIWQPCVERRHEMCPRIFFCWLLYSFFFFFFSHYHDCGPIEMAVILTRPFIWLVALLLLSFIPSICHTSFAQMWLTAKFCHPLMWLFSEGDKQEATGPL